MSDQSVRPIHLQTPGLDLPVTQTILTLTASSEDSILTRAQAASFFSSQRTPLPESSLLFYDLKTPQDSTFTPADNWTLRSLSRILLKEMIASGRFTELPSPSQSKRITLHSGTGLTLAEIGSASFGIRPASLRAPILNRLLSGTLQLRTGTRREPEDLLLPFGSCPECRRIVPPHTPCPQHPHIAPGPNQSLVISLRLQRLIWLAVKISSLGGSLHPRQSPPLGTLLIEPRLLHNDLPLLITFLLWQRPQLPFRELIVWPRNPAPKALPPSTGEAGPSHWTPTMLWPGWRGPNQAPHGRMRFVHRLEKTWQNLRRGTPALSDQKQSQSPVNGQIDRWLLHSFNLAVAAFIQCEEQRRPYLALDLMAVFIRRRFRGEYLFWRKVDWDQEAAIVHNTVTDTLDLLLAPYGLSGGRKPDAPSAPLKLYRRDWIFSREYRLLENARQIRHAILSLEGEIRGLGLSPQGQITLSQPKLRQIPHKLLAILRRIVPGIDMDVSLDNNRRNHAGLQSRAGAWRITLSLDDDRFRQDLLQRYRERLQEEQSRYEAFRALYTAHRNSADASQSHLRAMRGKLLKLKKRQIITLTRTHELR